HCVRNALARRGSDDQGFTNETRPKCPDWAEQFRLNDVPSSLGRITGSPSLNWMIECSALPPIWILTGEVAGQLISTNTLSLSNAIGGQETPLAMLNPGPEELQVLRI